MKTKCAAHYNQLKLSLELSKGKPLLDQLRKQNIPVPFSCGGEGICTTCRIILLEGELTPPSNLEQDRAQERNYQKNERLSCQCSAVSDFIEIQIP